MGSRFQSLKISYHLIIIFFLLSSAIGTAGYLYYHNQKKQIKQEKETELSAIANLKVDEIVNWRKEIISDGTLILHNPFLIPNLLQFLDEQSFIEFMHQRLDWMESLRKYKGYKSIYLLDRNGTARLSVAQKGESAGPHSKNLALEAMKTKRVILSDLHQGEIPNDIHLDLFVPILIREQSNTFSVGLLLLRVDPNKFLYPLTQSWPTPSETAETLLLRREGNEVVFLNELRHKKGTALSLRIPVSEQYLSSVMAAQGHEGIVEGKDYRGVPVLTALRTVPDSHWFLMTKVDIEEVYKPIRYRAWYVAILVMVLISATGLGVGFVWRNQLASFYQQQYTLEIERQSLIQRFSFLSKYANDIILLMDQNLKIIEANDRATTSYGYTYDELLHLSLKDLHSPDTFEIIKTKMNHLEVENGIVFETRQQKKDRTTFPVEISSRIIGVEGKKFYQSIIRDITERKKAEEYRTESEQKLYNIIQGSPIPTDLPPFFRTLSYVRLP